MSRAWLRLLAAALATYAGQIASVAIGLPRTRALSARRGDRTGCGPRCDRGRKLLCPVDPRYDTPMLRVRGTGTMLCATVGNERMGTLLGIIKK